MDVTNKRILGIILSSIGGIGAVLFGLFLSNVNSKMYWTQNQQDQDVMIFGILTGVSVILCIIGIVMISSTKSAQIIGADKSEQKGETKKSQISNLEELEKLSDLKEKGIITEEEFQNKKQKILNAL